MNWWKLLPVGYMKCPRDGEPLHWMVFASMRLRSTVGRAQVYQARCPKCNKEYDVLAPRENE